MMVMRHRKHGGAFLEFSEETTFHVSPECVQKPSSHLQPSISRHQDHNGVRGTEIAPETRGI